MPDLGRDTVALAMVESSQAGEARRLSLALARGIGLDATNQAKVALIVTELSNNLVRHAHGGELILRALRTPVRVGIEVLAIDRGPGVADFHRCLVDGYSTSGTPGTGLGAVVRLCETFDAYSVPGEGTVVAARFLVPPGDPPDASTAHPALDLGAVCLPLAGETACGDAWGLMGAGVGLTSLIVADGLGHGPKAAEASIAAINAFRQNPSFGPGEHLGAIHPALRGTRGASVAVALLDDNRREIRYSGIGNIAGTVYDVAEGRRGLVSHNGTVGATLPRIQEFTVPWSDGSLLIMHSDGLTTSWRLDNRLALKARTPGVIAGVLYRDFSRGRDDVTVVVARAGGGGE